MGVNYAWATVEFAPFGVPLIGIVNIDYKEVMEKVNNYGKGQRPVGRGYGRLTYDASIEVYQEEWKAIIASRTDRKPLNIPWFDVTCTYGNDPTNLTTDILRACEFKENPFVSKEGDTRMTIKIPLIIGDLDR